MKVLSVASRYSHQPEEKVITISRVKDADCPYRYYKNYIESPRQTRSFESIELGIGQFFHSFLESHFKRIMAERCAIDRGHRIDVVDLLRRFRLSFLWEGRLREPYRIVRPNYRIKDFQERLATVGSNFNHFLLTELIGHEIISVEGELQVRTDTCYIRGKHDLITKEPGTGLVLWDWKTGKKPKPEYFDEFEALKSQLGVYATWMRYKHDTTDVRGTAVFLRDELEMQSENFTPSVERDVLAYMAHWRSRLNEMTSYPAIPSALCDWCGWNEICDKCKELGVEAPEFDLSRRIPRPQSLEAQDKRSGAPFVANAAKRQGEKTEKAKYVLSPRERARFSRARVWGIIIFVVFLAWILWRILSGG